VRLPLTLQVVFDMMVGGGGRERDRGRGDDGMGGGDYRS